MASCVAVSVIIYYNVVSSDHAQAHAYCICIDMLHEKTTPWLLVIYLDWKHVKATTVAKDMFCSESLWKFMLAPELELCCSQHLKSNLAKPSNWVSNKVESEYILCNLQ